MTVTEKYRVSSGQYMGVVISLWLKRWWWAFALPIITQLFLAANYNIIFLYTAFISIFLIASPILTLIYYYYALTPEARIAIQEKHLQLTDEGIDIIFTPHEDGRPTPKPVFIPWNEITSLKYNKQYFILGLCGGNYRVILLPYSATADTDHLRAIATELQSRIKV